MMMRRSLAHHPAWNMRQRPIELMNDKDVSTLETLTPNDNRSLPTSRVKRIMNPPVALIPGSMSLLRLRVARIISHGRRWSGKPAVRTQAAAHRRRGRGRRGACDAGVVNKLRGGLKGRGGEGPGLRRPPQGDVAGHRHPHRRAGGQRRPRHQARKSYPKLGRAKKVPRPHQSVERNALGCSPRLRDIDCAP